MHLFCEKCHNIVGETAHGEDGAPCAKISVKIRGRRRRVYIVSAITCVTCDYCEHTGRPLPGLVDGTGCYAASGYASPAALNAHAAAFGGSR